MAKKDERDRHDAEARASSSAAREEAALVRAYAALPAAVHHKER